MCGFIFGPASQVTSVFNKILKHRGPDETRTDYFEKFAFGRMAITWKNACANSKTCKHTNAELKESKTCRNTMERRSTDTRLEGREIRLTE